jgi:hypothetical protein
MAGAVLIALGIAIFFATCWAVGRFEGWRFRAVEIGVPLALAVLFFTVPHAVPAPRYAGLAFAGFALATLLGAVRPFSDWYAALSPTRLFYKGSIEGVYVYMYAAVLTIALGLGFSAVTGIAVLP